MNDLTFNISNKFQKAKKYSKLTNLDHMELSGDLLPSKSGNLPDRAETLIALNNWIPVKCKNVAYPILQ